MTIIDDYIEYTRKYAQLYHDMLVLINVGDFYEIYGVDNTDEKAGADMAAVCDIMNIQSSRKNKSILANSRSNPMMAGFPRNSLKKYLDMLISAGYTVVIVDQVTPPPSPKREVTRIISPSTYIDTVFTFNNHYVMVIYLYTASDMRSRPFLQAICALADTSTGATRIHESSHVSHDSNVTLDEMTRWTVLYQPKELVVVSLPQQSSLETDVQISSWVAGITCPCKHNRSGTMPTSHTKLSYQNAVLAKVYPDRGMLSPIEYIDLEKNPDAVIVFVALIDFVYDHNDALVLNLHRPIIIREEGALVLATQAAEHLNIVSKGSASLSSMLNKCVTAMGKRCFNDRLLHPITDIKELEYRYSAIEACIADSRYQKIRTGLKPISDMERLIRRMALGYLQPCEYVTWLRSVEVTRDLVPTIAGIGAVWLPVYTQTLDDIIEQTAVTFITDAMEVNIASITTSFFRPGVHSDIDALQNIISEQDSRFTQVLDALRSMSSDPDFFKWEPDEASITITKRRYETLVAGLKEADKSRHAGLGLITKTVAPGTSHLQISTSWWNEAIGIRAKAASSLRTSVANEFKIFVTDIFTRFGTILQSIHECIAIVDVTATLAKQAVAHHYVRPIIRAQDNASYIEASALRHPLIEVIQHTVPYVPNDVSLRPGHRGMLLYGVNAAGKSSFMKSIGIAVIMAQAGMFVACDSMTFYPYTSLFTRIPGGDNLHKGMSTFVNEMADVRNILKRADAGSLLVSDELASGTETTSGIAIVMAGIALLSKRDVSFIFATHLHEISKMNRLKALTNVSVHHLSVTYDSASNTLVYDRKLKDGAGSSIYGLEVCRALDVDPEFMLLANQIRHDLMDMPASVVSTETSQYNARLFKDNCGICGGKQAEVHHIKQQRDADENGFIGHHHKNRLFNLMNICESCHDAVHAGKIEVDGYQQTTNGVQLGIRHIQDMNGK